MADPNVLFTAGFEGTVDEMSREGWSFSSVVATIDTDFPNNAGGYGGDQALRVFGTSAASFARTPSIPGVPYAVDVSYYYDGAAIAASQHFIRFLLAGASQLCVEFVGDGSVKIRRGGTTSTVIDTALAALTPVTDSRHRIQITLLAAEAGTCEVLLDGVSVLSYSGDTRALTTNGWDAVEIYNQNGSVVNKQPFVVDDLIVTDDANGGLFANEQRIARLNPTVQAFSDFTGDAGSASNLSDDNNATYNEGFAIGESQRYEIEDLPFAPVRTTAVILRPTFERDGVINALIPFVRLGGVDYPTDPVAGIGVGSFTSAQRIMQTNPATAADWEAAEVNAMEAGYELDG